MNKYYYIARRKQRGYSEHYIGDGIIEAHTPQEAKERVAANYGTAKSRVTIKEYKGN